MNAKQSARAAGGKLVVLAHSMGGIVASEALRLAGSTNLVDATILTQAAVSTEFYAGVATGTGTQYYSAFGGEVGGLNPRFKSIHQATTKCINFNNEEDYALVLGWNNNNNNYKPGGPDHGDITVTQTGFSGFTYDALATIPATVIRFPAAAPLTMAADRYEMFAHGLYTPAEAIGASNAAIGPFTASFDLRTIGLGHSRPDHSGQFNHANMDMKAYWQHVIQEAGL